MNMSPVSRLKKTWGKAKTAKFFILEVNSGRLLTGSEAQAGRFDINADVIDFDSIRWIPLETFTTTGPPCVGRPIALGLQTVTEKR